MEFSKYDIKIKIGIVKPWVSLESLKYWKIAWSLLLKCKWSTSSSLGQWLLHLIASNELVWVAFYLSCLFSFVSTIMNHEVSIIPHCLDFSNFQTAPECHNFLWIFIHSVAVLLLYSYWIILNFELQEHLHPHPLILLLACKKFWFCLQALYNSRCRKSNTRTFVVHDLLYNLI